MKIQIIQDCKVSIDGVNLIKFQDRSVVDYPKEKADLFLNAGYAELYKEIRIDPPVQTPEKQNKKPMKRRKK